MSNKYLCNVFAALFVILLTGTLCFAQPQGEGVPQPQYPSPVRELAGAQEQAVGGAGFIEIPISSADLRTAALVNVTAHNKTPKTSVERGANTTSAVYAGVALANALPATPPPAEASAPPLNQIFDFKTSGDSAQGWATMSAAGMPFLMTRVFGKATTSGTAAWEARVAVPAQQTNMYVRFTIPPVQVTGVNESDGPARYKSRFRTELLLNGHPVWSSEAIRFNQFSNPPGYCTVQGEQKTRFQTFGTPPSSLSATEKSDKSTQNSVTVALGSFPAGQMLDLSLVVRADTSVEGRCCTKNEELFCSGATALVDWSNTATPVRLWAGPAI